MQWKCLDKKVDGIIKSLKVQDILNKNLVGFATEI